jgi:hypothetical protein
MELNPNFWCDYFNNVFKKQILFFCESIFNRVLPVFDKIEEEAKIVARNEYEQFGNLPGDEYSDMADIADQAEDAGNFYYASMAAVKQTIINISTVGLHHMFEQQLLFFYRRQVLYPNKENDKQLMEIREIKKRLLSRNVNLESLVSWSKIEELRIVANTIKHAESNAAEKLRHLRPDLFTNPALRKDGYNFNFPHQTIYMPLSGEDIFLQTKDFKEYSTATMTFWEEFGKVINKKYLHKNC